MSKICALSKPNLPTDFAIVAGDQEALSMTSGFNMPEAAAFTLVDGIAVRTVRRNDTQGIPLLLTAPWPESIFAFNLVWARIGKLGPLTAVDLPGFGMSEGRPDLMSPHAMGDFLIRIMDALKIERAHVVAPDVGTLAVLFAASGHPERFESIVGGSGGISEELFGDSLRQIVASSKSDFVNFDSGQRVYELVKSAVRVSIPEAILQDYKSSSSGQRWNEAAEFVRAYRQDLPILAGLLPSIPTSTLVISGESDPIVPPANGQFLADRLPHCRAEIVNAGHFVWEDAADHYADLVSAWISGGYKRV